MKKHGRWPLRITLAAAAVRLAVGLRAARMPLTWDLGDVGQWMDAGDRMLAGEIPFQDFIGVSGPLLYAWTTFWYGLFGANWHAALLQLEVISPLICLGLAYYVARENLEDGPFRILFVAFAALVGLDRFYWAPALRVWVALSAWTALSSAHRDNAKPSAFAVAGALCGLSLLISAEAGAAAAAGGGVLLAGRVLEKKRLDNRGPLAILAGAGPIILFGLVWPAALAGYLHAMRGFARLTNWSMGLPLVFSGTWEGYCLLAPFLFLAAALYRRQDLSLIVFCGIILRSLLGRTESFHLLFILPPFALLWTRFCQSRRSPVLCATALLPFVIVSLTAPYGALNHARRVLFEAPREELADWKEEGIRGPKAFIERMQLIAAQVRAVSKEGERVLSLPLPLYAHLAGRVSALPALYSDQLVMWQDGPAKAAARLEAQPPSVVVLDAALRLPLPRDYFAGAQTPDPLDGRLTSFTFADEISTRELRAHLKSRYQLKLNAGGAAFWARRTRAAAAPEPALKSLLSGPLALAPGELKTLPVKALKAREVRLALKCRYLPLLDSLAKTYVKITVEFEGGAAPLKGFLPVPPESLGRDIRFLVPSEAIKSLSLQVVNPGALNPAPWAIVLESLNLN